MIIESPRVLTHPLAFCIHPLASLSFPWVVYQSDAIPHVVFLYNHTYPYYRAHVVIPSYTRRVLVQPNDRLRLSSKTIRTTFSIYGNLFCLLGISRDSISIYGNCRNVMVYPDNVVRIHIWKFHLFKCVEPIAWSMHRFI